MKKLIASLLLVTGLSTGCMVTTPIKTAKTAVVAAAATVIIMGVVYMVYIRDDNPRAVQQ